MPASFWRALVALVCCGCGADTTGPTPAVPTVAIEGAAVASDTASTSEPPPAPSPVAPQALGLVVLLTQDGISLKTSEGNVAPGCRGLGRGLTLPNRGDGRYDHEALARCARRLKDANPRFRDERSVTLMSAPDIAYQTIILVLDALHSDERGELFPDIAFAVSDP